MCSPSFGKICDGCSFFVLIWHGMTHTSFNFSKNVEVTFCWWALLVPRSCQTCWIFSAGSWFLKQYARATSSSGSVKGSILADSDGGSWPKWNESVASLQMGFMPKNFGYLIIYAHYDSLPVLASLIDHSSRHRLYILSGGNNWWSQYRIASNLTDISNYPYTISN